MTYSQILKHTILGGALALCLGTAQGADTATIRIAYNLPKDHATGVYFETLASEIDKRTADTSLHLKPKTFANGQLYNDTQLPDAVSTGGAEIGQMNVGFMNGPGTEPLRIWGLPFLFNSWEALWEVEDHPAYKGAFNRQFEEFNMHMLGWAQYGMVEFYASKPIGLPEDMKGLRMRAFGVDTSTLIKDLGGAPTSLSSQEMYQAVQRGTIDGFITGPTSVLSRKLYEVAKHGTNIGIQYLSFMATANKDWWDKLPDDTRDAVAQASDAAQKAARERAEVDDKASRDALREEGVETPELTVDEREQWVNASQSLYDAYLDHAGDEGRELLDIIKQANKNALGE